MPASLQGELQPTIYRFKLGGFEVATLLDGKSLREGLHPNFGGNASAEAVHALARANHIDSNRFEHPYIPTTSVGWSRPANWCSATRATCSAPPSSISGSAARTCARRASSIASCS